MLKILSTSINLIYSNNFEIVQALQKQLDNVDDDKTARNSAVSLNYLSLPDVCRSILTFTSQDQLTQVMKIFGQTAMIRSKSACLFVDNFNLTGENTAPAQKSIVDASSKFMLTFAEQVLVNYCGMVDEKEAKAQAATTKEKEEKEKKRFQELEALITFVFDVCSKETCAIIKAANNKL